MGKLSELLKMRNLKIEKGPLEKLSKSELVNMTYDLATQSKELLLNDRGWRYTDHQYSCSLNMGANDCNCDPDKATTEL